MARSKETNLKLVRLLETDPFVMNDIMHNISILEMEFNINSGDCRFIVKYTDVKNKERELYFDNLKEAVEQFTIINY